MLRRTCASLFAASTRRGQMAAAAASLQQQQLSMAGTAALRCGATVRFCATSSTTAAPANFNNNNNNNRRRNNRAPRVLPPAFDIVHWNDDDIAAGHLLRVIHQDSYIVLDYHRQASKVRRDAADAEAEEESGNSGSGAAAPARGGHAERVVTVTLPPVYIARFLGVLEGRAERVEVQSRFTDAVFEKKPGSAVEDKSYVLSCTSRRATSGQRQTADGQDVAEETVAWTVAMDPAESLMLHRFLTQALQYNTGFGRHI